MENEQQNENLARSERFKNSTRKFKTETKKAINTAMIAAFGFLIALVWKDVITEWVDKISAVSPVKGKLISALIVTLICVGGVLIVTKFSRVEGE